MAEVCYVKYNRTRQERFQIKTEIRREGGAYVAEYREDLGDPWASGMCLDLEELTDRLDKLCWPVHENEIPVYEL